MEPQPGLDADLHHPYGPYTIPEQVPYILPGAKVGVWQALFTRGGGECISGDAY